MKHSPSKFSMDLMPMTFGGSAESFWVDRNWLPHLPKTARGRRSEDGSFSGNLRLNCNQLDDYFSFQNRERILRPLPLLSKDETNVGRMKFGVEYSQLLQSCQGKPCASCAKFALDRNPIRAILPANENLYVVCVLPLSLPSLSRRLFAPAGTPAGRAIHGFAPERMGSVAERACVGRGVRILPQRPALPGLRARRSGSRSARSPGPRCMRTCW